MWSMPTSGFFKKSVALSILFVWAFFGGMYLLESFGLVADKMPEQVDRIIEDPLSAPAEQPLSFSIQSPAITLPAEPVPPVLLLIAPHTPMEGSGCGALLASYPKDSPPLVADLKLFQRFSNYRI